jgi:hypothetical protein
MENVEVDQQTDWEPAQAHIGQQLCMVDGMNGFDRFHFDNDSIFNHQVHPVSEFQFLSFVNYRQPDLSEHFQASSSEFVRQAGLVALSRRPGPRTEWTFMAELTITPVMSFIRGGLERI